MGLAVRMKITGEVSSMTILGFTRQGPRAVTMVKALTFQLNTEQGLQAGGMMDIHITEGQGKSHSQGDPWTSGQEVEVAHSPRLPAAEVKGRILPLGRCPPSARRLVTTR